MINEIMLRPSKCVHETSSDIFITVKRGASFSDSATFGFRRNVSGIRDFAKGG